MLSGSSGKNRYAHGSPSLTKFFRNALSMSRMSSGVHEDRSPVLSNASSISWRLSRIRDSFEILDALDDKLGYELRRSGMVRDGDGDGAVPRPIGRLTDPYTPIMS